MRKTLTCHIYTDRNFSDILTKVLFGQKQRRLVKGVMFDIYD